MPERIVRSWADETLHHVRGNQYRLERNNGDLIGEIRAVSDPEALEKAVMVARSYWEKKKSNMGRSA